MSEYILNVDDEGAAHQIIDKFGIEETKVYGYSFTGEEIVRCRDCEYRNPNASEAIWEKDGKIIHGFPERSGYLCHLINRCVDISGFCKWGKRREK